MTGGIWGVLTILGPILLAGVILFAILRNKTATTPADEARTEQATHDLYIAQDAADKAMDDQVQR